MFCCMLLNVHSSFAIILMGKRELVDSLSLSSRCLAVVVWLFLAVPWVCLQFVIVVFPDHTHFLKLVSTTKPICCLYLVLFGSKKSPCIHSNQFVFLNHLSSRMVHLFLIICPHLSHDPGLFQSIFPLAISTSNCTCAYVGGGSVAAGQHCSHCLWPGSCVWPLLLCSP